jgi:tetratricopeptide (TPR) repeat protein
MSNDTSANLTGSDPVARAGALIETAISSVQAGEHDAAMTDLHEAERLAKEADLPSLISAVYINQGYAHTVRGEHEEASRLYAEAAEVARKAGDDDRLLLALANLSVELRAQGKHAEVIETLTESLALLPEDATEARAQALIDRGVSRLETGDQSGALEDLQEADRIATEADVKALVCTARITLGHAYKMDEDLFSAITLYDQAAIMARSLEPDDYLRDALLSLALANMEFGAGLMAHAQFAEVETICREAGNNALLAYTLYWQGLNLQELRRTKQAQENWIEAAALYRELGEDGRLADCLLAQAEAFRRRGDHEAADPLFTEATEIYGRLGLREFVGSATYWHAMSLWSGGRAEEALALADEALRLADETADMELECRTHGLRAMVLADLGDLVAAGTELDVAEARCEEAGLPNLTVWMLARRAYLFAREGRTPDEVTQQLSDAYLFGFENNQSEKASSAMRRVISLIKSRCGEEYRAPVDALKEQLLTVPSDPALGDMPPDVRAELLAEQLPGAPIEPPPAQTDDEPADDD